MCRTARHPFFKGRYVVATAFARGETLDPHASFVIQLARMRQMITRHTAAPATASVIFPASVIRHHYL